MTSDDVRRALETPGPVLDPWLASVLAPVGWRRLAVAGIDRDDYSTLRALAGGSSPERVITDVVPFPARDAAVRVEAFSEGLPMRYASQGVEEARASPQRVRSSIAAGLEELAGSREATEIVAAMVQSLHPLHVADPAYDVSYSDPEVAFSIFLGIHEAPVEHEGLRIAEAMLHEAMHLQLSLAEDVVPLVAGAEERWTSPWRRQPRPAQGVLHGLYVFRAIAEFLSAVLTNGDQDRAAYVSCRLRTIDSEIGEAAGVAVSDDLTATGRALARRLAYSWLVK